MSNLRQIGMALIAYAMDNDGSLPAPGDAENPYPEDWVHWQPERDVSRGALMHYLGFHVEVLKCPAGVEEHSRIKPAAQMLRLSRPTRSAIP